MKAIKIIFGTACLAVTLLFGLVLSVGFHFPADLALVICSGWLAGTGFILIIWRNSPMLRRGRIIFFLNGGLLIGFFVFATVLPFVKARSTSSVNACINNLRQIDAAANQFALEHHLTNGAPINFPDDLTPYIKLNSAGKIPSCPAGGIYHLDKVGEPPTCSLSNSVTPAHILY